MALKPTIYKASLNLVDMNRDVYTTEKLTLALHPSETEIRMMVRLLAYALNYDEDLQFSKGLSATDEPDLWVIRPEGSVACWIEVGQASSDRLRKAVSRADQIKLYAYGSEVDIWWGKYQEEMSGLPKTKVYRFDADEVEALPEICSRNMELTITLSEEQIFIASGDQQLTLNLYTLQD